MRAVSHGGQAHNPSSYPSKDHYFFFTEKFISLLLLTHLLSSCSLVVTLGLQWSHHLLPLSPFFGKAHIEKHPFLAENTVRGPRTISVNYALKEEENHLSKELETHRSFKLLTQKEDNENSLVPPLNTTGYCRISQKEQVLV
ncbi:hypothetical protein AMTR_s00031p00173310 [Amborella trichopoda]|uniref:Uncharacterized protein n=1 Tax=Amborella trichopoda TaxID=13333 RepID=U5D2C9_AMBTC|nr:hypothetical protein AMTR_s00031p00173310 [Amborella trichopoda]